MRAAGAEALTITASPTFALDAPQFLARTLKAGLPTACQWREMAELGCMIGYGPSLLPGPPRRAASQIERIPKDAATATMPIEQPTQFELVLNARTAKTLGIAFPAALLARADEVTE